MMKPLHELVRTSIWELATNDESSKATAKRDDKILLDADENPYNWPLNRYP
ncbi:MAG: histidinol-phosphate transaminase, partial [Prevotellaceae bacterium]|nr:histidinol-phosphate transaminase [Prevotellaceae bacterium]